MGRWVPKNKRERFYGVSCGERGCILSKPVSQSSVSIGFLITQSKHPAEKEQFFMPLPIRKSAPFPTSWQVCEREVRSGHFVDKYVSGGEIFHDCEYAKKGQFLGHFAFGGSYFQSFRALPARAQNYAWHSAK